MEAFDKVISTHKTKIKEQVITDFLKQKFSKEVANLAYISGGESSQAFSFESEGEHYILRANIHGLEGFKKDQYAFQHFATANLVIPEVLEIGELNGDYFFCISRKADGETLQSFPNLERERVLPGVLNTLDAIHSIDITGTQGYGKWDTHAVAPKKSWREVILAVDEFVWGEPGKPSYFETTFLDKDLWERGYAEMKEWLQYCPEERSLVHGDVGFDNLMSDGERVTAVIDWAESKYGDFLYDAAWLSFWCRDNSYEQACREHYAGRSIAHLNERLKCYQAFIALDSLSFYAYSGQEDKAEFSKEKLLQLLAREA